VKRILTFPCILRIFLFNK